MSIKFRVVNYRGGKSHKFSAFPGNCKVSLCILKVLKSVLDILCINKPQSGL